MLICFLLLELLPDLATAMTIQVNEIHIGASITETRMVHVADRRLTVDGQFRSNSKKLFSVPYLRATVGYFGLAQPTDKPGETFSTWIPNVINHGSSISTLEEFAEYLKSELNSYVSKRLLRQYPSGFHVSGYGADAVPEFHFIRNIGGMDGPIYKDFSQSYIRSEDFKSRDAIKNDDGSHRRISSLRDCVFYYVNGDLEVFWQYWIVADQLMSAAGRSTSFRGLDSAADRAKWKLEVFGSFYERFSRKKIISKQVDVVELTSA